MVIIKPHAHFIGGLADGYQLGRMAGCLVGCQRQLVIIKLVISHGFIVVVKSFLSLL